MLKAKIKNTGEIIHIKRFIELYGLNFKKDGLEVICPACSSNLVLYAAVSIAVRPRFQHYKFQGDDCPLSCMNELSEKNINLHAIERGKILRNEVAQPEVLKQIYTFCHTLCGKRGRLSVQKFGSLIKKADQRNIWAYQNLSYWVVPFLLLALEDFEGSERNNPKKTFKFRFVIQEEFSGGNSKKVWDDAFTILNEILEKGTYVLKRVFSNGNAMNLIKGNPYPISKKTWEKYSQGSDWLLEKKYRTLFEGIKKCFD